MDHRTAYTSRNRHFHAFWMAAGISLTILACAGPTGMGAAGSEPGKTSSVPANPAITAAPASSPPRIDAGILLNEAARETVRSLGAGPVLPLSGGSVNGFSILFSNPDTSLDSIPDFSIKLSFREENGNPVSEKVYVVKSGRLQVSDLTRLEEGKFYQWEARLPDDPGALLGKGKLGLPLENHELLDDSVDHLARQSIAGTGMESGPGLDPCILVIPGGKKVPLPPTMLLSASSLADYPVLSGLESLRLEFRFDSPSLPVQAGMPVPSSRCLYRCIYPSGLAGTWHKLFDQYTVLDEEPFPLYPENGMHVWGSKWRFSWPVLPDSPTMLKLRYRLKGQAESAIAFRSDPSGFTVPASALGLKDAAGLEFLAWQVIWFKPGTAVPGESILRGPDTEPQAASIRFSSNDMVIAGGMAWDEPVVIVPPEGKLSFTMGKDNGQPDEKPARQVTISRPFAISPVPLNNMAGAEMLNRLIAYRDARLVDSGGTGGPDFIFDSNGQVLIGLGTLDFGRQLGIQAQKSKGGTWSFVPVPGKENHPLTGLSWRGSALICNELSHARGLEPAYSKNYRLGESGPYSFRLPLESEWEACASAAHGWAAPWGNRIDGLTANFDRSRDMYESLVPPYNDKGGPTVPVRYYQTARRASFPRNVAPANGFAYTEPWMLDMVGNIWEWCQDWYKPELYRDQAARLDQEAPEPDAESLSALRLRGQKPSRVVRGGAWNSRIEELYAQNRGSFPPESSSQSIGFRPAMSLGGE